MPLAHHPFIEGSPMAKASDIDSKTLNHFLGNEDVPTQNIEMMKTHATRALGRNMGKRVVDALERLEKKKGMK